MKESPVISRRTFLVTSSLAGGSLCLGWNFGSPAFAATGTEMNDWSPNAWLRIGSDNTVTYSFGGCEFGQGSMTGLTQIIAEELKVAFDAITIEPAIYGGGPTQVHYLTAGSSAIRRHYSRLRDAGATAREMLISAGATEMSVPRSLCHAKDGHVRGPNESLSYGELVTEAAKLSVPNDAPLTHEEEFEVIGQSIQRPDVALKVNGRAKYGMDIRLPGMVYGTVKHCPAFGGTLNAITRFPRDAIAVVELEAPQDRGATKAGHINAVAVVTDSNTWKAFDQAKRTRVEWDIPDESKDMDDEKMRTQAQELMESGDAFDATAPIGDVTDGLAEADHTIDATYSLPYVSHACMEVLNCIVDLTEDSCEIWVPVQDARSVHREAVRLLTDVLPEAAAAVTVHPTLAGGGLGRKIELDYYSQAIQTAIAVRQPLNFTWSREEDTRFDQYRPMALVNVQAGVTNDGKVTAWRYRNVSPSIFNQRGRGGYDSFSMEGATGLPYAFENSLIDWVAHPSGIPVGFWRSVAHSINCFAVEGAIDELAEKIDMDPISFRMQLLDKNEHPREMALLEKADAMSQWRHNLKEGHAWGMAFSEEAGTRVCEVVEIKGQENRIKVLRVACAVDCGQTINPALVEMQMEGGIIHGLNATLWGGQQFKEGEPQISNFNKLKTIRIKDAPEIEVGIIDSHEAPGGTGEPGVPPVAPAVANAYSRLINKRVRKLPLLGS